jgi:hypothetical protein
VVWEGSGREACPYPDLRYLGTILIADPAGQAVALSSHNSARVPAVLPDPFGADLNPWLLRRLDLATEIALQLREDAEDVLRASNA